LDGGNSTGYQFSKRAVSLCKKSMKPPKLDRKSIPIYQTLPAIEKCHYTTTTGNLVSNDSSVSQVAAATFNMLN